MEKLSEAEELQYNFWVHQTFAAAVDLRHIHVAQRVLLAEPWPLTYLSDRHRTLFSRGRTSIPLAPHFADGGEHPTDITLVLTLPHTICSCVLFLGWDSLLLPVKFGGDKDATGLGKHDGRNYLGIQYLAQNMNVHPRAVFAPSPVPPSLVARAFSPDDQPELMKFLTAIVNDVGEEDRTEDLTFWITKLRESERQRAQAPSLARLGVVHSMRLVRAIQLSVQLKNTKFLANALEASVKLALCTDEVPLWVEQALETSVKGCVSFRASDVRYWMDVAFMLATRHRDNSTPCVFYLQLDSSPQAGRENIKNEK